METIQLKGTPVGNAQIISKDHVNAYLIEPGIIVTEYISDFELDLDFAVQLGEEIAELVDFKPTPHIVIACPGLTVSKEAREWGATNEANRYNKRTAIVCNQLSHRIIGNFLIKVQRPPVQMRMFSDFESAYKWLTSFE